MRENRQGPPLSRTDRLRAAGLDPYPARCHPKVPIGELVWEKGRGRRERVWTAGRVVGVKRGSGALHLRLTDLSGSLDISFSIASLPDVFGTAADSVQPGDLVEVRVRFDGAVPAGEELRLLSPALRRREEEAIPSPETLRLRARVLREIRTFFDSRGYLEVETPALLLAPDPAPHLSTFSTRWDGAAAVPLLYLQTSPELPMKRLLGAGHERIYQITKFFRNGERTALHNPEFTGLEWYEAYADYRSGMETAEALLASVALHVLGTQEIIYQGGAVDLRPPWERIRVRDAFRTHAGFDLRACPDRDALAAAVKTTGVRVTPDDAWDDLFFKVMLEKVEPHLGRTRPALVYDYPAPLALLAKRKPDDPDVAERFEVYAGGMELANGFTELNDPAEQRERWERERSIRRERDPDRPPPPLDEAFLRSLEAGVPPATGVALGVDRLVMLLADEPDIDGVRCYPLDREK